MATSVFCQETLPAFVQRECGTELGGIIAVAFFDRDLVVSLTDLSTPSFWQQKTTSSPKKIWIVTDTRGSYNGGTPVEEDGYGKVVKVRTGADHEVNFEVRGIQNNRDFAAVINQTDKWNVAIITNGLLGFYSEDVAAYMTPMVEQGIKTTARWKGNLKWADDMSNPVVFDASAPTLASFFIN